jgi:hypothetical protein
VPAHPDKFNLVAHQFVTSGRYPLGRLIEAQIAITLLVVPLAVAAITVLMTPRGYPICIGSGIASMGATIIRPAGRLITPVFLFLTLALAAAPTRPRRPTVTPFVAISRTSESPRGRPPRQRSSTCGDAVDCHDQPPPRDGHPHVDQPAADPAATPVHRHVRTTRTQGERP